MNIETAIAPPRYKHDCERCVHLGQHEEFDLYYCEQGGGMPTLVARWSDSGPDYTSSFHATTPALNEARRIAIELELI